MNIEKLLKALVFLLALIFSSCKESSVKPKVCYECELIRVTSYKNLLAHENTLTVHSRFKECDMSYNQLIKTYNYVSLGDNTVINQTTFCKISSNL